MHNAAFAALRLDWTYELLDVPPGELADAMRSLRSPDVGGANVTIPYKRAVMDHLVFLTLGLGNGAVFAALALSLSFHLASFIGHAAELWLTLYLMGISTGFAEATLLESLSLAVRSAAFLIPSGWGAQEASLIALATLTGLSAESALAVGLVKRAREFAIGLPGLAAWAIAERAISSRSSRRLKLVKPQAPSTSARTLPPRSWR